MPRITFMGAGSTIFAKSVLGDCILTPEIKDLEISLHDIDPVRLEDSKMMLENLAENAGRKTERIGGADGYADFQRSTGFRSADSDTDADS